MAFGDVLQTKTASTGSAASVSVTFDSAVTAGNLILLFHSTGSDLSNPGTGMTEALVMDNAPDSDQVALYYRVVITADGATWSAACSPNDENALLGLEVEGPFAASPLDQTAVNSGNPVNAPGDADLTTGTTGTTAQADEFAAAIVGGRHSTQTIASLTNSFVDRGEVGSAAKFVGAGTKVLTATGTVETTWSFDNTPVDDYLSGIATFMKAGAAGTNLYLRDSTASGSNFGQIQVGGSAPSAATTTTGWTVDTVAATNYALLDYGVERLSTTFSGTAEPAGNPDNTLGDCFRSTNVMTGDFATGVWTITVPVIAVTGASGQDGRVRVRLWKSANATGTTPTEITAGAVVGTAVTNLATGAEQTSVATTSSITGFSMTSEYLFVQIAWEITGAAT